MSEIERLESVNKRLRAVLDTAVDAIITINKAGIIESFNPAAERIFGYTADEILGKSVNLLMPSPFREQHDSYLQNYFQTGEKKIIGIGREVPALRKDGTTFPAHIAVSEMLLGEERLFTGILRDVSIQKRAEERARQAERLAAIGQTVTGLAHESRNAFQRSKSCLEMLAIELEGQADPLELVGRTQRALDHVHHLYEEVRDYAAPLNLEPQPCNITRIWRDAWSQLEIVGKQKNVELREELAGADPTCQADWFALGQVFRNLLENAIVACPDPGEIVIRCRDARIDGREAIEISILDNGPGLEPESRENIFDAFFTTRAKGTGLGLAIVERIIEAHNGSIEIGNSPVGAEFVITLPRS